MKNDLSESLQPTVSVVLPVYEEADAIKHLIPDIVRTLQPMGITFEIVAVDDGSTDDSPAVLKTLRHE